MTLLLTHKTVPEMTDNVSNAMLNPTVPCRLHASVRGCGALCRRWSEGGIDTTVCRVSHWRWRKVEQRWDRFSFA